MHRLSSVKHTIFLKMLNSLLEKMANITPVVSLAMFGGLVKLLSTRDKAPSFFIFFVEIAIASFAGVVVHFILSDFEISDNLKSAMIAISGYTARDFLVLVSSFFLKKVNDKSI